jgi:3-methyladenine DNA glycosylase/8-oxoguanine DNA glycosylase
MPLAQPVQLLVVDVVPTHASPDLAKMNGHSNDEVIACLTSVCGIDQWTAERFLISGCASRTS